MGSESRTPLHSNPAGGLRAQRRGGGAAAGGSQPQGEGAPGLGHLAVQGGLAGVHGLYPEAPGAFNGRPDPSTRGGWGLKTRLIEGPKSIESEPLGSRKHSFPQSWGVCFPDFGHFLGLDSFCGKPTT